MTNQKTEMIYEILRIKQVTIESDCEIMTVRSPRDAAEIATRFIGDEDREVLLLLCLNTKNQITAVHRCHVGSINSSIVHPRELFKTAILSNSSSIIISHNHPSNNCEPSPEDLNVTRRIYDAGELLGIEMLDSIIVCNEVDKFVSLKEKGYL